MTLRSVPIAAINGDHLRSLVTEGEAELRAIEYKRDLPGNSDQEKREFLADVSSFANLAGGDLVYGVSEAGGMPQDLIGFKTENVDAEMNRLEESMRSGVEPRIEGLGLQPVPLEGGKHALVLRVPRSPARPHVVTYKNYWRFFSRGTTGKFQMNYPQVRRAFLSSGETEDKIRGFRDERLERVRSGETPSRSKDRAGQCCT